MKFSVCMIVKNEEQNIEKCLKSLQCLEAEIVVVDTGSTDRTVEIASKYTSSIYEFAWCDDFAAAKNFAMEKALNDMVLVVDADEFLEPITSEQREELNKSIQENSLLVGRVYRRNLLEKDGIEQESDEWINRIFSKKYFAYEGRIHEQVVAKEEQAYETYRTCLSFEHVGYRLTEEQRREKTQRNIVMLEREWKALEKELADGASHEKIQEQQPYILYQLGKSYYMAKDYKKACDFFSRGLSYDLNPKLEYVNDMVETYGYALLNSNRASEALFFENIYEEFKYSADFQFLMGLIYMNNELFDQAIEEFEKATGHSECRCKGVNSYLANYNIGIINECLGRMNEAKLYYMKCGNYDLAKKRLNHF
ncbi:MAG: glycosyltransferase [Roseburia sp.]